MKKSATTKGEIPVSADRCEDQGTGRLEGQVALSCPRSHQAGGPRRGRGVEVERRSGVVSRWTDLHQRDVQERREADIRQGASVKAPIGRRWENV